MKIVLNGVYNFLTFINEHWTMICAICVLIAAAWRKFKAFFSKSQEEQIAIAKAQISVTMLKLVTKAEQDWLEWQKAGGIKRSQVIDQIFVMYPILSQMSNQEEIIAWIDDAIDTALEEMRVIFEQNAENVGSEIVKQ